MTDLAASMERRMIVRLLQYWRDPINDGSSLPDLDRINPETLAETWDGCFILDFEEHVADPTFRFVGEGFASNAGRGLTGSTLSEVGAGTLLAHAWAISGIT